ncbi:2,5-didehydrogluconate reductase DkgB [Mariluticola halotolerans]|uniref:2,5-didehydrogluconate reductase DkgB n=1 Tax=Mariluticola halotolerans TaxID=2909283 RepID=UPI0026E22325|nr:2,5-didehydrogluconate reductase DkgB [Mariluticola halotolerans]UJQ93623.1 2,5-didehydrogluconate reductase DkgB [Mariluticola halotolerans]
MNHAIPQIGFGTWKLTGNDCITAVETALETGYRHIDTAQVYGNEAEVGTGIANSPVARADIFVTTKVFPENFGAFLPSLETSLEKLKLDQVDMTLIHWPAGNGKTSPEPYLTDLAKARDKGMTRLIGVSNFTIDLLKQAETILGKGALATNQIELHAYMQNRKLADFCKSIGLPVTAYLPLAGARLVDDPVIGKIAARHNAEASQVALAWLMQKGYIVIPKSGHPDRIRSNFAATKLTLTPDDISEIDALDRNERIVDPAHAPDWD